MGLQSPVRAPDRGPAEERSRTGGPAPFRTDIQALRALAGEQAAEQYEPVSRDELYEMFRLLTQAMLDKPDSGSQQRTEALQWLNFMLQVLLFVATIRQH